MRKSLPELLSMLKTAEVEIKKEHQVLMVNKSTNFKKGRKDNKSKGRNKRDGKSVAGSEKKPKAGPKPETECFYCKETGHWKRNCPKYLADEKNGKINKGIYDIHVIDVYLTSSRNSAGYLILVRLLTYVTRNRG
jgi:hypothetical protein